MLIIDRSQGILTRLRGQCVRKYPLGRFLECYNLSNNSELYRNIVVLYY